MAESPKAPRGTPARGEVACPACGTTAPATQTFCGHCGARLARARPEILDHVVEGLNEIIG